MSHFNARPAWRACEISSPVKADTLNTRGLSFGARCMLLAAIAVSGCGTNQFQQELQTEEAAIKLARETTDGGYQLIATPKLKALLGSGEEFLLVDAMPAASFEKGHLPDAVNFEFPKDAVDAWNDDAMGGRRKSDYEALLGEDKNRKIVTYCGFVTCARSHNAAFFARELGYTNVHRHPGGLYAWRGAGHSLTTK